MIEKLEPIKAFNCSDTPQAKMQHHSYHNDCINKINELVDAVNKVEKDIDDIKGRINFILGKMLEHLDMFDDIQQEIQELKQKD